jgi:NhaA family Na+:H+ antiporter
MASLKPRPGLRGHFESFFRSEVAGSVLLLACTVAALAWANSSLADSYFSLLSTYVGVGWGDAVFKLSVHHWINDGLMVVFFFVVGLEIKRELVVGELSSASKAVLPVAAALGGVLIPAGIFAALNFSGAGANGWSIPMATDIAFALGVLAILGSRVPLALKVFLTALAIADDLVAVAIIAVFYTEKINGVALVVAALLFAALYVAVRLNVRRRGILYLLIVGVWIAIFSSGIHATVAGILVAMIVPVRSRVDPGRFVSGTRETLDRLAAAGVTSESLLHDHEHLDLIESIHSEAADTLPAGLVLEHHLHPIQVWLIMPLFALANAGVAIGSDLGSVLSNQLALGIIFGLAVGKPLGITLMAWIAVKASRGALPEGVTWGQIVGVGCLAGVGFTMSLFISDLAFDDTVLISTAKVGIIAASLISGVVGFLLLKRTLG